MSQPTAMVPKGGVPGLYSLCKQPPCRARQERFGIRVPETLCIPARVE